MGKRARNSIRTLQLQSRTLRRNVLWTGEKQGSWEGASLPVARLLWWEQQSLILSPCAWGDLKLNSRISLSLPFMHTHMHAHAHTCMHTHACTHAHTHWSLLSLNYWASVIPFSSPWKRTTYSSRLPEQALRCGLSVSVSVYPLEKPWRLSQSSPTHTALCLTVLTDKLIKKLILQE